MRKKSVYTPPTTRPPIPIQGDPNHKEKSSAQKVVEILDSEAARPVSRFCPVCGLALECREATFFYENRSWEIHLTRCVECNGINRRGLKN